jgi:hypothetical protein
LHLGSNAKSAVGRMPKATRSYRTRPNSPRWPLPPLRPKSATYGVAADFRSAVQINDFLAKHSGLLIENRFTSRRAAVLAYIANLELRTLPPSIAKWLVIHWDEPAPAAARAQSNQPSDSLKGIRIAESGI